MSDLSHGAILLWSERQAALLRRRAADAGSCSAKVGIAPDIIINNWIVG